jgi:hypothetical protein
MGGFAAVGVFYICLLALTSFLPGSSCTVYPAMTVPSPSGKFSAFQEQETCTDDNQTKTVVWISDAKDPRTRWSAFRALSSQPTGTAGTFEPLRLQIAWLGEEDLLISFPYGTEVQGGEGTRYGVRVKYQETASGDRRDVR